MSSLFKEIMNAACKDYDGTTYYQGKFAVDELLSGKSNLVVCERNGSIVSMDIGFALTVDKMFKGLLSEEELAKIPPEDFAKMKAICEERAERKMLIYEAAREIGN